MSLYIVCVCDGSVCIPIHVQVEAKGKTQLSPSNIVMDNFISTWHKLQFFGKKECLPPDGPAGKPVINFLN